MSTETENKRTCQTEAGVNQHQQQQLQQQQQQPPAYTYMSAGPSDVSVLGTGGPGGGIPPPVVTGSNPACYGHGPTGYMEHQSLMQGRMQASAIMVTQPVIVTEPRAPDTTCALVMSTLSVMFCGPLCGLIGIIFAWKARMQVLNKKLEHARHTLNVSWLFFFIACFFGLGIWIGFVVFFISITSYRYY